MRYHITIVTMHLRPSLIRVLMQIYAGCAAFSALAELLSVLIVVIGYAYAALHKDDEIAKLLDGFAPTLVSQPVVLLAAGFVAGLVGIGIRLNVSV